MSNEYIKISLNYIVTYVFSFLFLSLWLGSLVKMGGGDEDILWVRPRFALARVSMTSELKEVGKRLNL